MTGFGEARLTDANLTLSVEIKSVNNRYFKLAMKCPEVVSRFEADIERLLREHVARGTLSVSIRLDRQGQASSQGINRASLEAYWNDAKRVADEIGVPVPDLGSLLTLPGIVQDTSLAGDVPEELWGVVEKGLLQATANLNTFRAREGAAMAADLEQNCQVIAQQLAAVIEVAPQVIVAYRDRLAERIGELLKGTAAEVSPADLIREVSLFADRCDISEEIARLKSHMEQFDRFLAERTSQGRKIEFLMQEIFRETNTIGSKANNVAIARHVVEMKAALERMREVIQNVE